jgi:hypothetical protein
MKPLAHELPRETAQNWKAAIVLGILTVGLAIDTPGTVQAADNGPAHASNPTIPTVGMEGRLEATLPGTLLEAKTADEKSLVILRIAETRPHGTLTWYDLRYVALVPGRYDLRNCLVRKDGSTTDDLPKLEIEISGLLPASHQGELVQQPRSLARFFGGYRETLIVVGILWLLTLFALILLGRKKAAGPAQPSAPLRPTLAQRLSPLIMKAAAGELSNDGKAHLERLLLSYWRERLDLAELSPGDAMVALRKNPEAGILLRALEDWLHRPPGVAHVDIHALLQPYLNPGEQHIAGNPAPLAQ